MRTCRVNAATYSNLVIYYLNLNRLEEARTTAEEAQAKKLDSPSLPINLYRLAFLQSDSGGMTQHVAWAAGKPGVENILLAYEAETAAYSSQLRKARELSRRALASAERAKAREAMAGYEARAALREALIGTAAQARRRAAAALAFSTGRDVQYGAALALALAGEPLGGRKSIGTCDEAAASRLDHLRQREAWDLARMGAKELNESHQNRKGAFSALLPKPMTKAKN